MDAFFCITFSIIILRMWWKHSFPKDNETLAKPRQTKMTIVNEEIDPEVKKRREEQVQREHDEEELRKQGYTDELIATILPIINNDN